MFERIKRKADDLVCTKSYIQSQMMFIRQFSPNFEIY